MGPVDVISRPRPLYDEVVVAVLHNPAKEAYYLQCLGADQLLHSALAPVPNVRIEAFAARLLVDICREAGAQAL